MCAVPRAGFSIPPPDHDHFACPKEIGRLSQERVRSTGFVALTAVRDHFFESLRMLKQIHSDLAGVAAEARLLPRTSMVSPDEQLCLGTNRLFAGLFFLNWRSL